MKKVFLNSILLLCALIVGSSSLWAADPSVSVSISTYATANSWDNETAYSSVVLNSFLTATGASGGSNNKYYSSNNSWRHYESSSGAVTITATDGYKLKSITFTYTRSNNGVLKYSGNNYSSGTACTAVDGQTSATFTVGHSSGSNKGNVQITNISVTYTAPSSVEETTTTIDYSGITNTNVYVGTAAGSLSATVKNESDEDVDGATVTWTSSNTSVATINASGVVTLVAAGSTTITASYAGETGVYEASSDTYNLDVTNDNPNALVIWSENFSGYAADAVPSGTISMPHTGTALDASGTLSYACTNGSGTTSIYAATLAGGTSPELLVGKSGGTFTATIPFDKYNGNLTLSYKTNAKSMTISTTTPGISTSGTTTFSTAGTHQVTFTGITAATPSITIVFTSGSENVRLDDIELKGCMAAPQFSVPEGSVIAGTKVSLSSTAGATIYYTTNGNNPSSSSTEYTSAITINDDVTIKAIAIKAGKSSAVSEAAYTIATDPFISLSTTAVDATDAETDGTITVTYNNLTNYDADIFWYEADGTTPATYDWLDAEINSSTKNVDYEIGENDTYSSRTAYLKVYAVGDEGDVYSDLITIAQAGKAIDFTTLPFEWEGGTAAGLAAVTGVTTYGLGSDYAESNAPYRVKMDGVGDYILVKTNEQPVKVYVDVKMLGGATASKIKIQECDTEDGTYTDVEELTISGASNTVLKLGTINPFKSTTRFVKIIKSFHGSNIGVGPIKITNSEAVTIGSAGYTTYVPTNKVSFPTGVTAYIVSATSASSVTLVEKESVPAKTPIILKGAAGNYTLSVLETAPEDVTGNLLQASTGFATGDASTIFALGVGKEDPYDGVVGFYVVKNGEKIPACKAYLTYGAGGAPSMLRLEDEEENATNVENIQAMGKAIKFIENGRILIKKNGIVYDTMGRIIR